MRKGSIMIVEDDPIVAALIESRLLQIGYSVFAKAKNENEVLEAIDTSFPDVILMDIILEGSEDGIVIAKKINEKNPVPIVFLTAHTDDETLNRVRETDHQGFIIKPFTDDDLRVSIELAIDSTRPS